MFGTYLSHLELSGIRLFLRNSRPFMLAFYTRPSLAHIRLKIPPRPPGPPNIRNGVFTGIIL